MERIGAKVVALAVLVLGGLMPMSAGADNNYVRDGEPTVLEVRYTRHEVTDTTSRSNRFYNEETMLRIGPTKSVFCSVKRLHNDSLVVVDPQTYWELSRIAFENDRTGQHTLERSGRYWVYLYKNYPTGKVTENAYFDMEHWLYEEDWEKPEWIIGDETKELLGYECFKAETDYRGRHWTAWFTPEIPIGEGPWKLCGLPGLILEAYDTNSDYSFVAEAVFSNTEAEVGFFTYNERRGVIKVSRDKYFNEWWKYKHRDIAGEIQSNMLNRPTQIKKDRNPNYDKEEINYPHNLKKDK